MTTIFISHRLGSTKLADVIYVIADGRIAESGSHEELMGKNGIYAEMFRAQGRMVQNSESGELPNGWRWRQMRKDKADERPKVSLLKVIMFGLTNMSALPALYIGINIVSVFTGFHGFATFMTQKFMIRWSVITGKAR